jgi:hypothetical protein
MSDTPTDPAAPVAPPLAPPAAPDLFSRASAIASHAAAWVYHGILAIERDVSAWASNPAIQPLVQDGMQYFETLLTTHGIPVNALGTLEQGFMSALRAWAANDPTVTSGGTAPASASTAA